MTRDDIIKLALDAGFCHDINNGIYLCSPMHIERFASLVAAAERSQCAALCSRFSARSMSPAECAAAIRARGN